MISNSQLGLMGPTVCQDMFCLLTGIEGREKGREQSRKTTQGLRRSVAFDHSNHFCRRYSSIRMKVYHITLQQARLHNTYQVADERSVPTVEPCYMVGYIDQHI